MIEVKPINVGIGGPLSALGAGLSGFSKALPWWALCPLYGVLATPLILLLPVLLPLWLLKVLSKQERPVGHYEQEVAAFKERFGHEIQKSAQTEKTQARIQVVVDESVEGISPEDVARAKDNASKLDRQLAQEQAQVQLSFSLVSHAMQGFKLGAFITRNKLLLALTTLAYYATLAVAFVLSSNLINQAMERYIVQASKSQVLQIATAEQLAYSNSVVNILTWAGLVVVLLLLVSFALVLSKAVQEQVQSLAQEEISIGSVRSLVMSVILKNLPGLGVLCAILYAAFITIERYYSHFRMLAIEAMVLGQEYFDPSLVFMGLRCYALYAFMVSLAIVILMSLHLIPLSHKAAAFK